MGGDAGGGPVVLLTLEVSGLALALAALARVPLGAGLALARFPGKGFLPAAVYAGMGLPPVVVGLAVSLLLSRSGPLAPLGWPFAPAAMVLSQATIALPLV